MATITKILLPLLFLAACAAQDSNNKFNCDEEFCLTATFEKECPAKRNCSTQATRTYLYPDKCNCCKDSFCIQYLQQDDTCSTYTVPADVNLCGPFLRCNSKQCVPISNQACSQERRLYDENYESGTVGTAQFKPECDAEGKYAQRQCLPGSVCYCADPDGRRIFGLGLPTEAMNCKCAKDIEYLTSVVGFHGKLARCLPNGNYDPIQCVGRECWCRLTPQVENRVDIGNITALWCYDKELHDTTAAAYLRACDYKLARIEAERIREERASGFVLIPNVPKCDHDGFFRPVQSLNGNLVCVDAYGNQLEEFQISKEHRRAGSVDCYCARIRKLMEDNVSGRPECCPHGNFKRWQCSGSLCYCVDRDGKQIVTGPEPHEVRKDELESLPCYTTDEDTCVY